jgi:hypothetical protein
MRFSKGIFPAAALLLPLVVATGAAAQDSSSSLQDIQFTGTFGWEYSNGDYGTTRNTNVMIELPTLSMETGDFRFTASMPYMRISGRGLLVFDAAGNPIVINRRTNLPPDTRTGWGDLNLSTTYSIPSSILDDFSVKVTGTLKLPTASERRRLSTGQVDVGLSLDISRQFGAWGPFLTLGYLIPGQPLTYTLYDTTSVSVGTSYEISDNLVAVASYDYDGSGTPLVTSSKEFFGSLSWIRDNGITLTSYATVGVSGGSPGIGGGLLLSYGFN